MPYVESSQKNLSFHHMIYQMLALELNYSPPPPPKKKKSDSKQLLSMKTQS